MRFLGRVAFFVLAGVAVLAWGLARSETPDLTCGDRELEQDETCFELGRDGDAYTYAEWISEQEQREHNKTVTLLIIGVGLLALAPVSYGLGVRRAERIADVGARRALAEARGWRLLAPPDPPADPRLPRIVSDVLAGPDVQVMDVRTPNNQGYDRHTVVVVTLPRPARTVAFSGSRIVKPAELRDVVATPEIRDLVRRCAILEWHTRGTDLVVRSWQIHDRQTESALVPLIGAALDLRGLLPEELFTRG